jgi:hypothetical protein
VDDLGKNGSTINESLKIGEVSTGMSVSAKSPVISLSRKLNEVSGS